QGRDRPCRLRQLHDGHRDDRRRARPRQVHMTDGPMIDFLIITGLSGAGASQAADTFEDLGWFVIDNLPPSLVMKVADLAQAPGSSTERVALVVRTGGDLAEITSNLAGLRATDARVRVLFLEASNDVLVRRFEDTRRRHPW